MECFMIVAGLYIMSFQFLHGLRIPLSKEFHSEQSSVEFLTSTRTDRLRRDTPFTNTNLPDEAFMRLRIGGQFQEIYLEKNNGIDIETIPVFTSSNGNIERSYISFNKEHALYQAPTVGGSFLVTSGRNDTTRNREVFGTFNHNNTLYAIQPTNDSEVKGEGHVVSRVPDQKLIFESHPPKEVSLPTVHREKVNSNLGNGNHGNRRNRRQTKAHNVEIMSVVDYKSYRFWYDLTSGSSRHSDTVQQVMQYLAYVINAVDTRYKTITGESFVFNILSAGVYIADTTQASPWSEDNVDQGKVPSSKTLDSFTKWINQQNNLPQFDHAMGFTGYDVVSATTGDSSGIAYTEALCTTESTSIIEDNSFNFITMTTAAHELGHSLGAKHDGADNSCDGNDNFIMAGVNRVVNDPVIGQHLWQFSTCSVQEFKAYISKLERQNRNCMLETSDSSEIPTTLRPMAETYGPDETCVLRFGEGSYVCRSIQDYEAICTGMYCNQPGTTQCYSTLPAEGTSCGQGKWCFQGRCVTSSLAPKNKPDDCVLGDRPGLFDDTGKTCEQHIGDDPGKCYGDYTGANCCESCNAKKTGDATCEFGDHSKSFCSSMARYGCYNSKNEQYCCSTCKQQNNSSLPGCEYGDRFSGCNKNDCRFYSAENLAGCCETCFDPTITPTTTTTTTTSTTTTKTTSTTTKPTITTTTPTSTTTTSTTRRPTTTTTTTRSTRPEITSKTTKPTTSSEDTTTQKGDFTSTQTSPDGKVSDMVLVAVGCGAGAIVVIVLVVIVCVYLRRRKAKMAAASGGRKPSRDNAYDNIGFVAGMTEKPRHPPPRRGSQTSSNQNISNGSINPPVSTVSNGSIEHTDGYMMPATMHITTPDGVHYTAPNKPKFRPLVPANKPKKKAFLAPKPSPDLNKLRTSKPVHYKRTSAMSNSSTDTIGKTSTMDDINVTGMALPDGYDSIGDIQKNPHNRRPTLPENHPGSVLDFNRFKNNQNDSNKKNDGDSSNSFPKNERYIPERRNDTSFDKRKVLPTLPPRPVPRFKPKLNRGLTDANSENTSDTDKNFTKTVQSDKSISNNAYEEIDNVQKLADEIQSHKPPTKPVPRRQISSTCLESEKPPTKPVPRRQISSTSSEDGTPVLPLKKALRPPMKPVPRRRTSSDNTEVAHLNLAFDNEQLEIQI